MTGIETTNSFLCMVLQSWYGGIQKRVVHSWRKEVALVQLVFYDESVAAIRFSAGAFLSISVD